jgi:crossover junction endodeoxyribonuclease RuvC
VIVLGIDPGFAFLGLGVLEVTNNSSRAVFTETFKTTGKRDGSDEARLNLIADRILDMIDDYKPAIIGYENQAGAEVGMQRRAREGEDDVGTNYSSRRVHEVSGSIRCAARLFELPCYCLAPSTIKVAVLGKGGGHAKKDRVKLAVQRMFGVAASEHAADAIAIAVGAVQAHRRAQLLLRAAKALIR